MVSFDRSAASLVTCCAELQGARRGHRGRVDLSRERQPEFVALGRHLVDEGLLILEKAVEVHIPEQVGHQFRSNPATDSVSIRPGIPVESGHRFRRNPATLLKG